MKNLLKTMVLIGGLFTAYKFGKFEAELKHAGEEMNKVIEHIYKEAIEKDNEKDETEDKTNEEETEEVED